MFDHRMIYRKKKIQIQAAPHNLLSLEQSKGGRNQRKKREQV